MTLLQAIVLGIVQGLTEFLPISSTAHLRIVPALLGWQDPGAAFSAVIQIGTVLAVLIYFRKDLWAMVTGFLRGLRAGKPLEDPHARLGLFIVAGTVPVVAAGLLFQKVIKSELRSLYVIAASLLVVGLAMAWADRRAVLSKLRQDGEGVSFRDALFIGFAQMFALIPGVSRSGSTIAAGLVRGLPRAEAARFSFLLSIPAVTGAGLKELLDLRHEGGLEGDGLMLVIVATVVSFVVGYAAIAGLIAFLKKRSVMVFVGYRILLAVALLGMLGAGVISHLDGAEASVVVVPADGGR
ncbi:undecaprenyl-diphosphatase UppP [Vulgatibacter incomptus]|uniref:Undecaprenyl-diphosphatase n=1 Tax=Vulgatibacter incomptus TaxID=1391653 RepID=A0A0K1PGW2_9BACT|nr:undecaprenyl-diphosphatase UppP [Vulgatibacter incomptus]AKU92359.1 Undecaprenyl-diphosphatase [Vulgatibacter incomptus]